MATTDTQPRTNRRRDTRKTDDLNAVRAAFMQRASAPHINPFAFKLAYLIAFKYLSRESRTTFVAQQTLARDLNVTTRTVRTLLDILQPLGLVVAPGHGPNRASTYWLDPDKATPGSPGKTEKRKPASGNNRKPASALKPNSGSWVHEKRKLGARKAEASFHPTLENYQENYQGAGASTPAPRGERERELALADPPGALAPDGGAPEEGKEVAVDRFADLLAIWQRPWGEDDDAARIAFVEACREADPDAIIASAQAWVAAADHPRYLKPLTEWLAKGLWKKSPPSRAPKRNGKVSLSALALEIGSQWGCS
jgi:hypothetical protein